MGPQYPRPDRVKIESGEYVVHFSNHEHDRNPSTYVRGRFKTLHMQGVNQPRPTKGEKFFLPCGMTAQELVNYVYAHCQIRPPFPDQPVPIKRHYTRPTKQENANPNGFMQG